MNVIAQWFRRTFSNTQLVILAALLVGGTIFVMWFGEILAPVLTSAILAYLLEGPLTRLEKVGVPRFAAAVFVYLFFIVLLMLLIFVFVPQLYIQIGQMLQEAPSMIAKAQDALLELPQKYPTVFTETQVQEWIGGLAKELQEGIQGVVGSSLKIGMGFTYALVFMVLVPFLVFFMIKDKETIKDWFTRFMPQDYSLAKQVWSDVDLQIGNYVRGKVIEIVIVGVASYIAFLVLGLNYALVLGVLVGLSVLIPYVGATVVTIPVLAAGYFQWGATDQFLYLFIAYSVIQGLDGNFLVPILFSEVVNLHPVAIIVAILFFGGIWGFWGVFFAIPLATLVQAVLKAWPQAPDPQPEIRAEA